MISVRESALDFTSKNLYGIFAYINREVFGGSLIVPKLVAVNKKVNDAYATFTFEHDTTSPNPKIYIYNSLAPENETEFEYWCSDLAHEVAHYFIFTKYLKKFTNKNKIDDRILEKMEHTPEFFNIVSKIISALHLESEKIFMNEEREMAKEHEEGRSVVAAKKQTEKDFSNINFGPLDEDFGQIRNLKINKTPGPKPTKVHPPKYSPQSNKPNDMLYLIKKIVVNLRAHFNNLEIRDPKPRITDPTIAPRTYIANMILNGNRIGYLEQTMGSDKVVLKFEKNNSIFMLYDDSNIFKTIELINNEIEKYNKNNLAANIGYREMIRMAVIKR